MGILCAQYAVEVQFEDYIDGNVINHKALEDAFRVAMQEALDKLQYIGDTPGYRTINPLIMPMTVTSVMFETDYPHPDNLSSSCDAFTAEQWHMHLVQVEGLRLSELTDREYVKDRIQIIRENEGLNSLSEPAIEVVTRAIVEIAKRGC